MNALCKLRLCRTTKVAQDGIYKVKDGRTTLATVYECPYPDCGRKRYDIWAEERRKNWIKDNGLHFTFLR